MRPGWRQYPGGVVSRHIARQTGREVTVVRNDQAGLDDDDGHAPYSTICEEHGFCIAHSTLKLALAHAADPLGWCEACYDLKQGKCRECGNPPSADNNCGFCRNCYT